MVALKLIFVILLTSDPQLGKTIKIPPIWKLKGKIRSLLNYYFYSKYLVWMGLTINPASCEGPKENISRIIKCFIVKLFD